MKRRRTPVAVAEAVGRAAVLLAVLFLCRLPTAVLAQPEQQPPAEASPASEPIPVLPHEAPALAILDGPSLPNAFPMRAGALAFPEPDRPGLGQVLVAVATEHLSFVPDFVRGQYASDFTILARLLNEEGQVVRKLSQRYEMTGPLAQRDQALRGEVIFYRQPELPPGRYALEAIVYDAPTALASVRLGSLEIAPPGPGELRASSLMIVNHSERVPAEERDRANPLYYGELLLYPNLGEPLRKGQDTEVSFFLTVYSGEETRKPHAILELLRLGASLAKVPIDLPEPDYRGRIQHAGRLPLDPLSAGTYQLRITVGDGAETVSRSASFTVLD